jgi:hypothetical protein
LRSGYFIFRLLHHHMGLIFEVDHERKQRAGGSHWVAGIESHARMDGTESHRLATGDKKVAGEFLVRRWQRNRDLALHWIPERVSLVDAPHVEFEQSFLFRKLLSDQRLKGIDILIEHGPDKGSKQCI